MIHTVVLYADSHFKCFRVLCVSFDAICEMVFIAEQYANPCLSALVFLSLLMALHIMTTLILLDKSCSYGHIYQAYAEMKKKINQTTARVKKLCSMNSFLVCITCFAAEQCTSPYLRSRVI